MHAFPFILSHRVLMFANANSDVVERRHIKFPIVCSKLDVKTMPFMLTGLFKKLRNAEGNAITKNTNGIFFLLIWAMFRIFRQTSDALS